MAMLEYIHPPTGATRLLRGTAPEFPDSGKPATKVTVPVPHSSPPASPRPPSMGSPSLSTIPQLLLSASLPSVMHPGLPAGPTTPSTVSGFTTYNPRRKTDQTPVLLSSKDPLSLPIMTNNFKRFVMVVGPVFWLQDRVEEVVLWKRGASWTTIWMAGYTLLCLYPRLLFLLPHLVLISAILATYPYPSNPAINPLYASDTPAAAAAAPPVEGAGPWQANIQAIQNLMGAYADFHSVVEPYARHLCLTPAHFATARQFPIYNAPSTVSTSPSSQLLTTSRSPYTIHILALLVLSFFPVLFIVHLPWFPMRGFCILAGWIPILCTHPYAQAVISVLQPALLPIVQKRMLLMGMDDGALPTRCTPISTIIQQIIDDDRLTDECWNSEMREVELWENERYNGPMPPPLTADGSSSSGAAAMRKGWGKQHLKCGERGPWTRNRDGSNDASAVGAGSGPEASGEVSSNLTFSLAPGWCFVESEDWRKDLEATWSGCGCDIDGWVYTNDAWLGPRPAPYTCGGGSITRRRRWHRRVWYNQKKAEEADI